MEVEVEGVIYEGKEATDVCSACVAIDNIGLCSDITNQTFCFGVIWIKKEDKESVKNIK